MKCLFTQVIDYMGFPSHVSKANFYFLCSYSSLWNKGEVWIQVQKASKEIAQTELHCGIVGGSVGLGW